MKNVVIASVIAVSMSTSAMAELPEGITLEPAGMMDTVECTNTDIVIGVVGGVVGGALLGVSSIIGLPVAGAAAGTTLTWSAAFSAPFLTNATATSAAIGGTLGAPLVGAVTYYGSCVTRNLF